jgi:hypothetical protein
MTSGKGWQAVLARVYAHVLPVGDLREHRRSEKCWCHPAYYEGLFVHHSMDDRESEQPAEFESFVHGGARRVFQGMA